MYAVVFVSDREKQLETKTLFHFSVFFESPTSVTEK